MSEGILEVGDQIISGSHGVYDLVMEVKRVTATQAITKCGSRFRREYDGGDLVPVGGYESGYLVRFYCFATPELIKEFNEQKRRRKAIGFIQGDSFRFRDLSTEKLEAIGKIIEEE